MFAHERASWATIGAVDLEMAIERADDATVIAPAGDIDVHTAAQLRAAIVDAEARGAPAA